MDALLVGAIASYIYLTNVQGVAAPEAFEFDNLACTVSSRQGDDMLIGCGPLLPQGGSLTAADALAAIRKSYPDYAGLTDPALKDALRRKYYPGLGPKEFDTRLPAIAAELTGSANTVFRVIVSFGGSIRELAPKKGEEESWAAALRLLPNLRCARWQGKYWKCRVQPGAPAPVAAPDSSE